MQQARRAASRPAPGRSQPLVQPSRRAARRLVSAPSASAPPSGSRSRSTNQSSGTVTVPLPVASAPHRASAPDASLPRRISTGAVPEELIAQVQQVLQGKSRGAVIRELMRTNLDVNTAANNLLSRDDDEMSESEDLAGEAYADEMLINWMEDAADSPDAYLARSSRLGAGLTSIYGSERSDKLGHQSSVVAMIGSKLETLRFASPEIGEIKFVSIGVLLSELLCICDNGQLYQWRWDQEFPYCENSSSAGIFHPKAAVLGLTTEKVRIMAACGIRASFLTNSGKLATLIDESGGIVAKKLEHPATAFTELQNEKIADLVVCMLYSCARVESGSLYWWGVMPLGYRHRALEKARSKTKKTKTVPASDIQAGSTVVYKSNALYQPGAIGFRINSYGELQCGELMDNMWDLSSVMRFKLLDAKSGKPMLSDGASGKATSEFVGSELPSNELALMGKRTADTAMTDDEVYVTESWNTRDVVILEEGGRTSMVGKVSRVTDDHAYVIFNPSEIDMETSDADKSPLLKKSDLQLFKGHSSVSTTRSVDCIQRVPKKLRISGGCKKVLACAPNLRNIQMVILGMSGKLSFITYNLQSGKKDVQSRFLCDAKYILGNQERDLKLVTGGRDAVTVMLDGNSCIYPIEKDCVGSLRIPHALNCSPVQSLNVFMRYLAIPGRASSKIPCGVVAFVVRKDSLIQCILENSVEKVHATLQMAPDRLHRMILECSDGNRNIFHSAAAVCAPQPRKDFPRSLSSARLETDSLPKREDELLDLVPLPDFPDHPGSSSSSEYIHHLFSRKSGTASGLQRRIRESALARFHHLERTVNDETVHQLCRSTKALSTPSGIPEGDGDGNGHSRTRTERSRTILELLCNHTEIRKLFLELMSMKNSSGMTPFMYAVLIRSYEAALMMLSTTTSVIRDSYPEFGLNPVDSKTVDALVMDFLYPPGSPADDSPLFVLCLNDVCTFTWTGACHIQQDVWECRTCGLTGSLCCCTECARTCHRGHECRIKRSSPTAYCDCWEKCKCQSLVSGDESLRLELFSKLINMSTDLVVRPSSRNEYLIQYLVHTVGRQLGEQRFLKSNRGTRHADLLSPPKFCQMALTLLLGSYEALKTALLTGYPNPRLAAFSSAVQEDQFHLSYQSGTASLDKFVHVLLTKCNSDHIDAFIRTIQAAVGDFGDGNDTSMEAQEMTNRFVRSIVRVFVILTSETAQNSKAKEQTLPKSLRKIRKIFRQLPLLSIVELCEAAEALITPVRLGVARPSSSFIPINAYSENSRGSDELFNTEPLAERRRGRNRREIHTSNTAPQEEPVPFDDDFQLIYRPEAARSRSTLRTPHVISTANRTPPSSQSGEAEEPHSAFSVATIPLAEAEVANASDMDIDDDGDSDNTDSDNGEGNDFERTVVVEQGGSQPAEANPAQDPFSDDNDDDDNDDSDPSTGTHEEDDDDEEEDEGESDGVDMDDSGSMEGDDENLYPFFMEANTRGGGNAVYVRAAPSISMTHSSRLSGNAALPPGLQWASSPTTGSRPSARTREFFPSSGATLRSSYIYMDSFGMYRRSPATLDGTSPSFSSTFSNLARSYGTIVREVAELLVEMREPSVRQEHISMDSSKLERLEIFVSESLKRTWNWLCQIMDSTEAQLRFGYALHQSSDTAPAQTPRSQSSRDHEDPRSSVHPSYSLPTTVRKSSREVSATASSRNDFLGYMLSLMRAHNSEHGDSLPVLDVAALKHVAFVFDAMVYYLRITSDPNNLSELRKVRGNQPWGLPFDEDEIDPEMPLPLVYEQSATIHLKSASERNRASASASAESCRSHSFFRRARSMCYLGSAQPDPFKKSLSDSLPLADRPQLLLPNARREELFGAKLVDYSSEVPTGSPASFKSPPVRLSLTNRQEDARPWLVGDDSDEEYGEDNPHSEDTETETGASSARKRVLSASITQDLLLGRWRQTLDTFSRVFAEDFSGESGSLIADIAAFPVKEAKFRKEMERLRGTQARDLIMDVQRARGDLIPESFAALNQFFNRRSNPSAPQPCAKIKVTFRDEPGEGNGVARSFFTVLAEALLSSERLPQLDRPAPPHAQERRWISSDSRMRFMRSDSGSSNRRSVSESEMSELNMADLRSSAGRNSWPDMAASIGARAAAAAAGGRSGERNLTEALSHTISSLRPSFTAATVQRISAMLMQLDPGMVQVLLQHDEMLSVRIDEAALAIQAHRSESHSPSGYLPFPIVTDNSGATLTGNLKTHETPAKEEEKVEEKLKDDDEPLFYEPGRPGFYALRPGKSSVARLLAFRNVGRLIGLALLQGEIFPLCLTRATAKFILDRPRTWSDFAFHDPVMFETLRKLVVDIETGVINEEEVAELYLYFAVDLPLEEGGKDLELKPQGRNVPVTRENIYEFVKLATEMRMGKMAEKVLDALKRGVHDVIPGETLEILTPEDFRLLLNGVDRAIDIQQLASWTNWQDETNDKTQDKTRFKHWFWNTVDKFSNEEKQELVSGRWRNK
ncbi:E3 ubiquitin-protein ligase UBR5-like isoform X2 [Paramacrobiotus metropolitanus]|uniref:E3 ubiquitin-protein ligase UBR5-like isoform X2 n=1 Tax=Paramacrobiotus metropolitanus TaxID=2943436 RepID=UPI0024463F8A|nr:E3 ubiquitin-protein ligase UBR5-like isoform X2 [Paramacrobiotus metropolitanus]